MPNKELLMQTLDKVQMLPKVVTADLPDEPTLGDHVGQGWDQNTWLHRDACGTFACFAGWAVEMGADEVFWKDTRHGGQRFGAALIGGEYFDEVRDAAMMLLDISKVEADYLFTSSASKDHLIEAVYRLTDGWRLKRDGDGLFVWFRDQEEPAR